MAERRSGGRWQPAPSSIQVPFLVYHQVRNIPKLSNRPEVCVSAVFPEA
jgi:hypothetical protein